MDNNNWVKLCFLFTVMKFAISYEDKTAASDSEDKSARVLSRTKRYLVFPEGSSFQLVICTQNHGYLQLGDIVWFGNTAALAWELPTDPNIFQYLIKSEKKFFEGVRRKDEKHIVYVNENGKVLSKVPYHRKFIVNPAFAKRSVDGAAESNAISTVSRKNMHEGEKHESVIQGLDDLSRRFHREARKILYPKIETLLEGLGLNGKECLLRLLCEHSKPKHEQGSFLHEILKATFTFPRHASDYHQEYDIDHSTNADCASLYPECEVDKEVLFNEVHC